jgi:single-strand DNA-binding protein
MLRHNSCLIIGHVGLDPVERGRTPKSGPVVTFTLAENVRHYDPETQSFQTVHTNWFQITCFGALAERVKTHLKKGDRVIVQGRMRVTKYVDRKGEDRLSFGILADEVAFWQSLPPVVTEAAASA